MARQFGQRLIRQAEDVTEFASGREGFDFGLFAATARNDEVDIRVAG
jgi:hypothetical protein